MAKIDVDSNNDVLLADVNRYNYLFFLEGKSTAEKNELAALQVTLVDYLLAASDYNGVVTQQNTNTSNISTNTTNIEDNTNNVDILRTFPTVGGTVDAITLTTPTSDDFNYTIDGNPTTFIPSGNNTGASTVSLDGGSVDAIVKSDGAGGTTALEADDILEGVPTTLYRRTGTTNFFLAPKGGADPIVSIQRGFVTVNSTLETIVLGTTLTDYTNAVIYINFRGTTNATGTQYKEYKLRAEITSNTQAEIRKQLDGGHDLVAYYTIIEYNPKVVSVQHVSTQETLSGLGAKTVDVTIASVNVDRTEVFGSYDMQRDSSIDNIRSDWGYYLLNSTTVRWECTYDGDSGVNNFETYIVTYL